MVEKTRSDAVTDENYKASVFEDGGNLVVDLSGIAEAKFEAVPKGIYLAEIDSVEFGMSQNSGQPMLTLQIVITEGDYQGRKHYTYWSFGQKALPFTKAAIARIAPELLTGKFNPQQVADEGKLLGRPCRIRISVEEYNGEPRSKINQVLSASTTAGSNGSTGNAKGFF